MPTTTNYGWTTPADTDLVKDGAAAIRTLGNSVDTTTKNLNPETTLGDIAYRSSTANTNTRLPIGTTGQVLTVAAGVPSWATPNVGDITAVTAGTGLSGGGTSGDVSLAIDSTVATLTETQTLTNKTIALGSNTVSGTTAQFNTALTDGDFATLAGSETLTNKTLTSPIVNLALNAQTGTTYTFVLADNGKLVTASNAAAQTYSIPTNASVAYAIGAQINIIQIGAGQVTINAVTPGTTTISSTGATSSAPKLRVQFSSATCIKVATDTWYVVGDIA